MKALALALLLAPTLTFAETLTYEFDRAESEIEAETATELCSLPMQLSFEAKEDLPTVVIRRLQCADGTVPEIKYIQATSGSMSGGDLKEPYMGEYRVRVALVKHPGGEAYPAGIYTRVQVTTYGSTAAPKAFKVDRELLNYLESAELAEDEVCSGYAYKLKR